MEGQPTGKSFSLTGKIGPLETWEWIAIGVGGFFVYSRFIHKDTAATDASSVDDPNASLDDGIDTGSTDDVTGGSDWLSGSGTTSGASSGYDATSNDGAGIPGFSATNQSWLLSAIDGLLGSQYDPADVNDALNNYVNGDPISSPLQRQIISTALAKFGPPPNPLAIIGTPVPPPDDSVPGVTTTASGTPTGTAAGATAATAPAKAAVPASKSRPPGTIKDLQNGLNVVGHNHLVLTGKMDAPTIAILKVFQAHRGLPATGVADQKTWDILRQDMGH